MANHPRRWRYPVAQPASLRMAVLLMYTGAAIGVAKGIVDGLTTSNLSIYTYSSTLPGTATVHQSRSLIAGVVMGLTEGGLWLWMARKTGAGRRWARVVCGVLFGFSCLMLIGGFSTYADAGHKVLALVLVVTGWVVGLAALIQLWQRDSSRFFASARQNALADRGGPC